MLSLCTFGCKICLGFFPNQIYMIISVSPFSVILRYTIGEVTQYKEFLGLHFIDGDWHTLLLHFGNLRKASTTASVSIDCTDSSKLDLNGKLSRIFTKSSIPSAILQFGSSPDAARPLRLKVKQLFLFTLNFQSIAYTLLHLVPQQTFHFICM